jgi:hypothetical protein
MAITKPAVLPPWAENAANPADIVQPTNEQIQAGWPLSTTPPSRQRFNWVLNFCANAVRYFSRRGIADYDAAETYEIGDLTRGDNGLLYRSQTATNINHTPSTSPTQWGSPLAPTPAADDSSTKFATTAYVIGQISVTVPVMDSTGAVGVSLKFARADHRHPSDSTKANTSGTYNSLNVGFALQAGGVSWPNVSLKPTTVSGYGITDAITTANIGAQSVSYANSAGRAYPNRSDGTLIYIIWSGQGGQPNWLLGSNDGTSFYVYNPANFSVNYATSAGTASFANNATNASFAVTQAAGTSNTAIATTQFANPASYHATNGYVRLASGLLMQWGQSGAIGGNGAQIQVFPVAFPSACFNVQITAASGIGSSQSHDITSSIGLSTFVINNRATTASVYHWFAIGV